MGQSKKSSNFKKRLILTLVAVPLILFFLFWPEKNHLPIMIIIFLAIPVFGSYEFSDLIAKRGIKLNKFLLPFVNSIFFLFSYFYANNIFIIQSYKLTVPLFFAFFIIVFSLMQALDIFKNDLSHSFDKMAFLIMGVIYIGIPSFLMPFLFNISTSPEQPISFFVNIDSKGTLMGSLMAVLFITNVFANDIFAYVFGMAFGRGNVLNLTASPKKSIAGYVGGVVATLFFVAIYYILFDKNVPILNNPFKVLELPWHFYFILPVVGGIAVPVGDLVESVIKRTCLVKDSGNIIMGRGGILDSIDSIIYFFPIFFIYVQIYFIILS